jgi:MarR family transcriptional regulator, organic hydroperoxide resistance regulator
MLNKSLLTMSDSIVSTSIPELQAVLAPRGFGYRIKLLSQLIVRKFQERLEPMGLTPFHWVVLCCLWQEDGQAIGSIGEKLQQVGATLTGVLDRMEERGLVRRERDLQDRRIWRIWLTDAGKELQQILPPIALEFQEEIFKGIPKTKRKQISSLLDRMIINMSDS